jgi:cytochrome P450 / NADPH-cytochrome P450 reductase
MVDFLTESSLRARRPGIVQAFMKGSQAKWEQDIKTMAELADRSEHFISFSSVDTMNL